MNAKHRPDLEAFLRRTVYFDISEDVDSAWVRLIPEAQTQGFLAINDKVVKRIYPVLEGNFLFAFKAYV